MKLLVRWLITVAALVAAAFFIPGIRVEDTSAWIAFGIMAAVLALVNAIIRPILAFLSCGCIVLTMGLFMLVINAIMAGHRLLRGWFLGSPLWRHHCQHRFLVAVAHLC